MSVARSFTTIAPPRGTTWKNQVSLPISTIKSRSYGRCHTTLQRVSVKSHPQVTIVIDLVIRAVIIVVKVDSKSPLKPMQCRRHTQGLVPRHDTLCAATIPSAPRSQKISTTSEFRRKVVKKFCRDFQNAGLPQDLKDLCALGCIDRPLNTVLACEFFGSQASVPPRPRRQRISGRATPGGEEPEMPSRSLLPNASGWQASPRSFPRVGLDCPDSLERVCAAPRPACAGAGLTPSRTSNGQPSGKHLAHPVRQKRRSQDSAPVSKARQYAGDFDTHNSNAQPENCTEIQGHCRLFAGLAFNSSVVQTVTLQNKTERQIYL